MNRRLAPFAVLSLLFVIAACARAPEPPSASASPPPAPAALPPGHPPLDGGHAAIAAAHGAAEPGPAARVEEATRAADPREKARRGRTVALVNGEPIVLQDLEVRLEELHREVEAGGRRAFDLDHLMFRLVNDRLLAQEARALGMDAEEPTRGQVERYRRDEMLGELEREEILSKARVTDAEVRRAFEEQYHRLDLRVITVDERPAAEEILARVRAGADMAALAAERSHDPYRSRGGLASGLPRRDLAPEVGAVAATLEPGGLGGPVMTDLGWTVVRLEGTREADPKDLQAAAPIVRDLLTLEKVAARRADLAARIAAKFPVQVEEETARAIVPERLPDGRLAPRIANRAAPVARIAAEATVTAGEYGDALLLRWSGVRSEEAARAAAPIILKGLVDRALLLAEARALGYARRPEVERRVRDHETRLLVQRYLEEVLGREIAVEADEMQTYYDAHRSEFPRPPRLRLSQITVASDEEAGRVVDQIRRGADVAWLARRQSTDRFASSGGDRGWIVPQPGTGEPNASLMTAKPGDVLGPFGQPGNFTVIRVMAREDQGPYPFADVSGNVRSAVFGGKFRQVLDERVTRLRARARIEIREDVLASLRVSGTVDERPAATRSRGGAR